MRLPGPVPAYRRGAKIDDRRWRNYLLIGLITFTALLVTARSITENQTPLGDSRPATARDNPKTTEETPEPGRRLCAVRLDERSPAPEGIKAGDKVDLVASFPAGSGGEPYSKTIIRAVRVVETPRGEDAVFTISVSPEDAERIAFSSANGVISITQCPNGPDASLPSDGITIDGL